MATRQVAIKTGVCNRLVKEVQSYKDESTAQAIRVAKMEAAEEDIYEIRQQKRVHADSLQMIPDSEKRLAKAILDLEDLLEANRYELSGTEEFGKAELALTNARASTTTSTGESSTESIA